ncbi:efflux RND transporter periplasmic adaptor subunit [bacterium]|nr:efflux RND transporter periplasmic adaptor subunit [bacterium]
MKTKKAIAFTALLLIVSLVSAYFLFGKTSGEFAFTTTKVEKGSVSNTITATGTLEATNTIVVGTQVSGVIEKIYVDFNSNVKKGELIAELDKSTLQFSLETAEADVSNSQAEFDYQKSNFERMNEVFEKGLLSETDYDLATFNYKKSEAALKSAKANLKRAEKNLGYASIYAPIDGVVLNCAVEEGQTVTASMSTPELFTIVNDLTTMQVEANIDEADIGQVKIGQRVEFSVDAFSDDKFDGEVSEVRLQPNETSNVVTYSVIIKVANPELKLMPGLTASIITYVEEANDVLIVSEKATSFTPDQQLLQGFLSQFGSDQNSKDKRSEENDDQLRPDPPSENEESSDDSKRMVWVKDGDSIEPVMVEIGIDDGSNVEVLSGLEENDVVLTSMEYTTNSLIKSSENDDEQKSPFIQEGQTRPGGGSGPPK